MEIRIYRMELDLIGLTLEIVGEVMIAFTALRVHYRFRKEHRIDKRVFSSMQREHVVGITGIILMVIGYLFQLPVVL